MALPFKELKSSRIYSKTFLKDVTVNVFFDKHNPCQGDSEKLCEFFRSNFNLEENPGNIINRIEHPQGYNIKSDDGLIIFSFSLSSVTLKMKFPAYRQFSFALRWMPLVASFLETLKIANLSGLSIIKFNELQFRLPGNQRSVKDAMEGIFSPELMEIGQFSDSEIQNSESIEKSVQFTDESRNLAAKIIFGFKKNEGDNLAGNLILKTSISKHSPLGIKDIEQSLLGCNALVDGEFHWAVTESIIKQMD